MWENITGGWFKPSLGTSDPGRPCLAATHYDTSISCLSIVRGSVKEPEYFSCSLHYYFDSTTSVEMV